MSCWTIIKMELKIKATADEVAEALKAMKFKLNPYLLNTITTHSGATFTKNSDGTWDVVNAPDFNTALFKREIQRAKILLEAKRLGYDVLRNEVVGDKMVIRCRVK